MKRTLFWLIACLFLFGQNSFAISLADASKVGLCGYDNAAGNEHIHVTTRPSRVFSMTVTSVSANGWAALIETHNTTGTEENSAVGWPLVSKGTLKADIPIAVAGETVSVTFSDEGIAIGGKLFLDCYTARVAVEYRD